MYQARRILAPFLMTSAVLLLWLAPSAVLFGIGYALWNSGMVIFTIWMRTRRLEFIDPARVGGTLGFFVAIILSSTPVAGLLLAVLGNWVESQRLLLFTAVLSALGCVATRPPCPCDGLGGIMTSPAILLVGVGVMAEPYLDAARRNGLQIAVVETAQRLLALTERYPLIDQEVLEDGEASHETGWVRPALALYRSHCDQ